MTGVWTTAALWLGLALVATLVVNLAGCLLIG